METRNPIFVYVVCPDVAVARTIGRKVVEDHMAACVNILPAVQAIYRWQGRIEDANEVGMFIKTTSDRFDELSDYIRLLHPYDVPCIVALPVVAGEQTYLRWILDNSDPSVSLTGPALG